MEKESKVRVDFTIKGADPNAKMGPHAQCAICSKTFAKHTIEMHKEGAAKTREQMRY